MGSNCILGIAEKNHIAWVVGRPASPVVHTQVYVLDNSCILGSTEKNHTWVVCRPASVVCRPASQVGQACVWDNSCIRCSMETNHIWVPSGEDNSNCRKCSTAKDHRWVRHRQFHILDTRRK